MRVSDTNLILDLIDRGGIRQTESELRYQLAKRNHPLAEGPDLYKCLVEFEREGLIQTELTLALTDEGRSRLARPDGVDSRPSAALGRQAGLEGN